MRGMGGLSLICISGSSPYEICIERGFHSHNKRYERPLKSFVVVRTDRKEDKRSGGKEVVEWENHISTWIFCFGTSVPPPLLPYIVIFGHVQWFSQAIFTDVFITGDYLGSSHSSYTSKLWFLDSTSWKTTTMDFLCGSWLPAMLHRYPNATAVWQLGCVFLDVSGFVDMLHRIED